MNKSPVPIYIMVALLTLCAIGTILRNDTWSSEMLLWKDVVSKSPNLPSGHLMVGGEHHKNGNLPLALQEYQIAAKLANDRLQRYHDFRSLDQLAAAQTNTGYLLEGVGDRETAERAYRSTLQLIRNYPPAVYRLSILLNRSGRFAESITVIDGLIAVDDYGAGFQERGKLYYSKGEAQCAIGFATQANENFRYARSIEFGLPFVECR